MQAAEHRFEILKFLSEMHFGSHKQGAEFLKFAPEPPRNRSKILKFALASTRLADTAQNFISRNGFKILKLVCEPLRALHRVLSRVDSAKAGRAEKFSKFDFANALLNFISLLSRKFKLTLLKFSPAPSRNGFRILKFTPEPLRNRFEILNFTLAPHKFKPAPAVRLNFALNSIPPASASKFENGVKFKGAAKFERSAR